MRLRELCFAAAVVSTAAIAPGADACCPAFQPDGPVRIADQEVLITYDPETGTEHFVRSAAFRPERPGDEKDFGFLVPTPTQPTLAEAEGSVFERLREVIKPRPVWVNDYQLEPTLLGYLFVTPTMSARLTTSEPASASSRMANSVRVLDRARVAGYDAVVLEAKDAGALTAWLSDNGYDARPALKEWAEPYVAAGWKVTAFKYAPKVKGRAEISTKAVRLSFKTDRPLFPFRVPTDNIAPPGRGNMLRLFYVGPGRAQAKLGESGSKWQAETKFAAPAGELDADLASVLEGAVPAGDLAKQPWLTAFEDGTWPSGTDDLYFSSEPDATPLIPVIERKRKVRVPLGLDVLAMLGLGVFVFRFRKRGAAR